MSEEKLRCFFSAMEPRFARASLPALVESQRDKRARKQEMEAMEIEDLAEEINSRDDFENFMQKLVEDFREFSDQWENADLSEYLAAMQRFVGDIDGYYKNRGESINLDIPTWRVFADVLLAARVYE